MRQSIAMLRRQFLQTFAGAVAAEGVLGRRTLTAQTRARKVVVVTFGGGARDDETFSPGGRENIPHLLTELLPRSTFYSQVVNRGILGHYVATASLVTGVYETFNNFAAVAPGNPTVFEYYRRDLKRPVSDAWVIAPSNGFARIGESEHRSYGKGLGGGVILPKRLLAAALGSSANRSQHSHLLQDSYESPIYAPALDRNQPELERIGKVLDLSVSDFSARAQNLASPDELSVYIARQLMRKVSPSFLWITLHDIDVAHCGTFSLYIDAIRRTDSLCSQIWKTIQQEPEYSGKTSMFILPDFGRDSDTEPGGNGFQHHRTGDIHSRTTWMLATGPGIRENMVVDRPVDSLDLVPTLGSLLGFSPTLAKGKVLAELA